MIGVNFSHFGIIAFVAVLASLPAFFAALVPPRSQPCFLPMLYFYFRRGMRGRSGLVPGFHILSIFKMQPSEYQARYNC